METDCLFDLERAVRIDNCVPEFPAMGARVARESAFRIVVRSTPAIAWERNDDIRNRHRGEH